MNASWSLKGNEIENETKIDHVTWVMTKTGTLRLLDYDEMSSMSSSHKNTNILSSLMLADEINKQK